MIPGLFPRLFGTFKEGGYIHQQFIFTVIGTTPTILIKTAGNAPNQVQPVATTARAGTILLARGAGVGLYTLTLVGGARRFTLAQAEYLNKAGVFASDIDIHVATQVESTGIMNIHFNLASTGLATDGITINDEVHVTLYADK